jgi:C_GCAxxG_C_C family probable redox protein
LIKLTVFDSIFYKRGYITGMYEKDGKRFNCSESVIMFVNDEIPLEGFGKGVMRANSNLGGGGAGWGSLCGAVNGGCQVYGLLMGTNGDESPEEYTAMREVMRAKTHVYLKAFEEKWGHINCFDLLGCDTRTPEGKAKHEENKAKGIYYCEDFVKWSAAKIIELVRADPDIKLP